MTVSTTAENPPDPDGPLLPFEGRDTDGAPSPEVLESAFEAGRKLNESFMPYRFAIQEVLTKLQILRDEISIREQYSPIEHISDRIKSLDSIVGKLRRRSLPLSVTSMHENLTDIAGIRVTCSFIGDTYRMQKLLDAQPDIRTLELKDYIAEPKPNGYRGLHAIMETPVHLSTGSEPVKVEIQFRTIAMDFWASLEHKTFYKYDRDVPARLLAELTEAAETANLLDKRMESIHREVRGAGATKR